MKRVYHLLAFDLGASNGRAILGTFDGDQIVMQELHRFENNYIEMNGVFYWDLPYLFSQMKQGLLAFKRLGVGDLDCMGIDTWGVDYGLLDKHGHLLGNPRSYRGATDEDVAATHAVVDFPTLYSRTGIGSMPFNTIYQLHTRVREGDVGLEVADKLLLLPDLLGYFLTGEIGAEYTHATTTMMLNAETGDWDWETMDALGIPKHIFPKIQKSCSLRGCLRPELAEEIGLNQAAYAAIGCHDTASAVAAIPGTGSFAFCSSGTWSLFGVETDHAIVTDEAREQNFSSEGTIQGGYRPLQNIMGMWLIQDCRRDWIKESGKTISWNDIVIEARKAEPFRSIINVDASEFYAGGDMVNKIQNFCRKTGQLVPETIGQVARCIYESVALRYRLALEGLEQIKGEKINSLNIVGGGCNNKMLDQMVADCLNRPVTIGPVEGAAIGNLLGQAMALGAVKDLEDLRRVVRNSEPVEEFEPHHTEAWDKAYERMLSYR